MSALDDNTLSIAPQGPEGDIAPVSPAPTTPGFLAASRKRSIGNASYRLDATKATPLPNIAGGAQSAIFIVEAAEGTTDTSKPLARFWMDGTWPDTISGLPAYDGAVIEVIGLDDMQNFRIISRDGLTHKINVQYFSYM